MIRQYSDSVTLLLCVILLGLFVPIAAFGGHTVVTIPSANMTTYQTQEEDRGDYFMLEFRVPSAVSGKDMDAIILELYVDASAYSRRADLYENAAPGKPEAFVNDAPTLQVFVPKSSYQGGVDAGALDLDLRVSEPILVGEGKRMLIDVTRLLQGVVAGTETNYGLVLGSITGMRDGNFTILSGSVASGAVAKIHFHPAVVE